MNIDKMTYGELKEIASISNGDRNNNGSDTLYEGLIGKYVIVRSHNEGLNAGYLEKAEAAGCVITEAKRLFRPISKDRGLSWYEGVSVSGLGDKSVVSGAVEKKVISESYSLTVCTQTAVDSIRGFKANETTC